MARETDTVKSKQRGGQAKEEEESEKHKLSRQQSGRAEEGEEAAAIPVC